MIRYANIYLWDLHLGAITEDDSGRIVLEYTPEFVKSGYNPSPIFATPQEGRLYEFSQLPYETFKGLPGFIADCLPDKFGTAIINRWLEQSNAVVFKMCVQYQMKDTTFSALAAQ